MEDDDGLVVDDFLALVEGEKYKFGDPLPTAQMGQNRRRENRRVKRKRESEGTERESERNDR